MWLFGLRIALGLGFFILGIIGLLIPVMPQLVFFILSALMFFPRHQRLNAYLDRGETRFPRFVAWLRRIGIGAPDEASAIPRSRPLRPGDPSPAYESDIAERNRYTE